MAARFWVGGTGTWSSTNTTNWSATSGGAGGASVPTTTDDVTFDASSGTGTVTTNYSPTVISLTQSASNITLTLGADLTTSGTFTLTAGTVNLVSYKLLPNTFVSSGTTSRTLNIGSGNCQVTGNVTCSGSSFSIPSYSGSFTCVWGGATARTFAGGGFNWQGYVNFGSGTAGTGTITVTGSNTFGTIASSRTVAYTILFTAGTTTTVTNWSINGSSGNLVTINSTTAGSQFNIAKAGGGNVIANYFNIKDSNATPSNTWAAISSTNSGNNTGWNFATYSRILTIASTVTDSLINSILKNISKSTSATLYITKNINKIVSISSAVTNVFNRFISLNKTVSSSVSSVLASTKIKIVSLAASSIASLNLVKKVGKNISILSSVGIAFNRFISLTKSLSILATNSLVTLKAKFVNLTVSVASTVTLLQKLLKNITFNVSITSSITINQLKTYIRTLSKSVVVSISYNRLMGLIKSVSVTSTKSIVKLIKLVKSVSIASTISNILARAFNIYANVNAYAYVVALANVSYNANGTITVTGKVVATGYISGEEWTPQTPQSDTWTEVAAVSDTWTTLTPQSDTWYQQG